MQQRPQSTVEMRQRVIQRVGESEPNKGVVLATEYHIAASNEQAFTQLVEGFVAKTKSAPGLTHISHSKPLGSRRGGRIVQLDTHEEWTTRDVFLSHWNSDYVQQFQRAIEPLQLREYPTRLKLSAVSGGVQISPGAKVRPLATGQRASWDAKGNELPTSAKPGDDGHHKKGYTHGDGPRFQDNGNGTVTDRRTELTWLKNANLLGEVPWPAALQYAAQLRTGSHGLSDASNPGDWRLPNVNEMQSLLDLSNTFGSALPADSPFMNLEASNYWTSSSVALAPALGWFVALAVGPPVFDLKMNSMRMWPVKGRTSRVAQTGLKQCFDVWGQPVPCTGTGQDGELHTGVPWPAARFTDNKNEGTVTDNLTGLVWLQDAEAFGRKSWQDALTACNTLASGQHGLKDESKAGNWRLPNVHELRSLIDYSQHAPALPNGHPFKGVQSSLYWSSTSVASEPRFARFVFIGVGPSVWDHKSVLMNVWPVRDAL